MPYTNRLLVLLVFILHFIKVQTLKIVTNDQKKYGICLTPKIASSVILNVIVWRELNFTEACKISLLHIKDAVNACKKYDIATKRSVYNIKKYPHPLRGYDYDKKFKTREIIVPFRDPWARLLSAYASKFLGLCKKNHRCLRDNYLNDMPENEPPENDLSWYLRGFVFLAQNKKLQDPHFALQSRQCLNPGLFGNSSLYNIDREMDKISDSLSLFGNDSIGRTVKTSHGYKHTGHLRYAVEGELLKQTFRALKPDYDILTPGTDHGKTIKANRLYSVFISNYTYKLL